MQPYAHSFANLDCISFFPKLFSPPLLHMQLVLTSVFYAYNVSVFVSAAIDFGNKVVYKTRLVLYSLCAVRVTQTPMTLDELGEGLLLWENLNTELPTLEAKISPLFDQFAILDKYEVAVADDVRTMLMELPAKFRDFEQTLVDADIMLKKHKVT